MSTEAEKVVDNVNKSVENRGEDEAKAFHYKDLNNLFKESIYVPIPLWSRVNMASSDDGLGFSKEEELNFLMMPPVMIKTPTLLRQLVCDPPLKELENNEKEYVELCGKEMEAQYSKEELLNMRKGNRQLRKILVNKVASANGKAISEKVLSRNLIQAYYDIALCLCKHMMADKIVRNQAESSEVFRWTRTWIEESYESSKAFLIKLGEKYGADALKALGESWLRWNWDQGSTDAQGDKGKKGEGYDKDREACRKGYEHFYNEVKDRVPESVYDDFLKEASKQLAQVITLLERSILKMLSFAMERVREDARPVSLTYRAVARKNVALQSAIGNKKKNSRAGKKKESDFIEELERENREKIFDQLVNVFDAECCERLKEVSSWDYNLPLIKGNGGFRDKYAYWVLSKCSLVRETMVEETFKLLPPQFQNEPSVKYSCAWLTNINVNTFEFLKTIYDEEIDSKIETQEKKEGEEPRLVIKPLRADILSVISFLCQSIPWNDNNNNPSDSSDATGGLLGKKDVVVDVKTNASTTYSNDLLTKTI